MLGSVGLAGRAVKRPTPLSGRQRQRVTSVRAMMSGPGAWVVDGPTIGATGVIWIPCDEEVFFVDVSDSA